MLQASTTGGISLEVHTHVRKRFRVLLLAAIVAAFVVPVGFALSLESESVTHTYHAAAGITGAAPIWLGNADGPMRALLHPVPDAVKLILVGTTLFGLAAAVRKSI
jgi:hypothetical protein